MSFNSLFRFLAKASCWFLAVAMAPALTRGTNAETDKTKDVASPAAVMVSSGAISLSGRGILREIVDPYSGGRWVLMRDPDHPGGPGRLVLAEAGNGGKRAHAGETPADEALPVIRAGDKLVIEEHSSVVDAQFEAVALGAAREGSLLKVRLKLGGKTLSAIALGPGRAVFTSEAEGK